MNVVAREITPQTLANEVRMMRANGCDSFFLLEGGDDARLFNKFIVKECTITVCHGRENLIAALTILEKMSFDGAVGLADKDFADDLGFPDHPVTVIFTDDNDMEIVMISSPAIAAIIREFGNETKANSECTTKETTFAELVYSWAAPVGAIRLSSHRNNLAMLFKGMKYKFETGTAPQLCAETSVPYIVDRTPNLENHKALEILAQASTVQNEVPNKALCRGHDCLRELGRALRYNFGGNSEFDSDQKYEKLGKLLRLAYEYEFFKQTRAYNSIRDWERGSGYSILRD